MIPRAGLCSSERQLLKDVFWEGLDEAEFDSTYAGAPDMDMNLLRGKQMTITIDIAKSKLDKKLQLIKRGYGFSEPKVLSTVFLQGLFQYYLLLKDTSLYKHDEKFKREVDEMPHDLFYDM